MVRLATIFVMLSAALLTTACNKSNNLFFGEVRATVGAHAVEVTDCYRTRVPPPESLSDGYHFTPCRDSDIVIRNEALSVNGKAYGPLKPGDSILVDHGVVSVNGQQARQ